MQLQDNPIAQRRGLSQVNISLPVLQELRAAVVHSPPPAPALKRSAIAPDGSAATVLATAPVLTPHHESGKAAVAVQGGPNQLLFNAPGPARSTGLSTGDHPGIGPSSDPPQYKTAQNATASAGSQQGNSSAPVEQALKTDASELNSVATSTSQISSLAAVNLLPSALVQAANGPPTSPSSSGPTSGEAPPASPSLNLLSILPAIMQTLDSQQHDASRSLNITVSGVMSPNVTSDGAPALSGDLANTQVETTPHTVDVQVLTLHTCSYTIPVTCPAWDSNLSHLWSMASTSDCAKEFECIVIL